MSSRNLSAAMLPTGTSAMRTLAQLSCSVASHSKPAIL